jgi:3-hydroxybutyrate dehydrogenase
MDPIDGNHYKMLDINITHPIRVTQLAIAHFLNKKQLGSIVHISSVAGQRSASPTPLYNASKHAISGFVRSLRGLEKRFGIRVSAVAPGLIKTPLWTEARLHLPSYAVL